MKFLSKIQRGMLSLLCVGTLLPFTVHAQESSQQYIPTPVLPTDDLTRESTSEENQVQINDTKDTQSSSTAQTGQFFSDATELSTLPKLIYTANEFESEELRQQYIDFLESDAATKDQIAYTIPENEERVLLYTHYKDTASENGLPILFYVSTQNLFPEGTKAFGDKMVAIYPDIFFKAEQVEGTETDLIFGVKPKADVDALSFNEEKSTIEYSGKRDAFSFEGTKEEVAAQQAEIEQAFPGQFSFTSETSGDNVVVNATPTDNQATSHSTEGRQTDSVLTSFLSRFGINVSPTVALIGLGVLIIVLLAILITMLLSR